MAAVGQPSGVSTASESAGCPFCRGSGVLALPDGSQAVCACRLGIPASERGLDRVARGDGPAVVTKGVARGS